MTSTHSVVRALLMAALAACLLPPPSAFAAAKSKPAQPAQAADKFGLPESRAAVLALPEVQAWHDKRKEVAAGMKNGLPAGGIIAARRMVKGVKHWAVSLIDDPQSEAKKWGVFLVRASDGKIFVEAAEGKLITLEDWRKTRAAV